MWEVTSVGISGQKAWREGVLSLVSRGAEDEVLRSMTTSLGPYIAARVW